MIKRNNIAIGIALSSAVFASQAMTAGDGTMGSTSTGQSDVTLEIVDQVKITGLDNIELGSFDGVNDLNGSTAFCVYRNGGKDYTMTISVESKSTLEVASSTTGETIRFTAKVDNDNDASNGTAIEYGTRTTYSGSSAFDCNNTDNASLAVNFAAADLSAAGAADDYTATVVILMQPI